MRSAARNLNETYDSTPGSVAQARTQLADFAAQVGATPRQVEAVRLAASEAMTNAVRHAYRGGSGLVYVNAAVASGELWILISDDGCGLRPRADPPGIGLGLGLGLMSQVSDDFGIVSRATAGTEVRVRFKLVPAEAGTGTPAGGEQTGSGIGRAGLSPSMSVA